MPTLQLAFSVWIGHNVKDFHIFGDTIVYLNVEGYLMSLLKDTSEEWRYDTLLSVGRGSRLFSRCSPYLFVAFLRGIATYMGDSLLEGVRIPTKIEGMFCRQETLYLYNSSYLYRRIVRGPLYLAYVSQSILHKAFLWNDTLYILDGQRLVRLQDKSPVRSFDSLPELRDVWMRPSLYLLVTEDSLLLAFKDDGVTLLLENVGQLRLVGDSLFVLKEDTLKAYLLKMRRR